VRNLRTPVFALLGCVFLATVHADDQLPAAAPWLHGFLPDDALMYARIPHPFGMLAAPKGNSLDPVMRSDANVATILKIREGMAANVLPRIPAFQDLRLRMLEKHLRAPLELAVLPLPAPSLLVSTRLDVSSTEAFASLLAELAAEGAGLSLVAPLDERGVGQVEGLSVPSFVQFDDGRLLLNVGPSVSPESFATILDGIVQNADHAMRRMERRVDTSGQGIFLWVNTERALAMATVMMQPEQFEQITDAGLDKTASVGIGWGVADGKGRISVVADLRPEYDRGFVPDVSIDIRARSVGEPDALLLLAIPTADEFERIETRVLDSLEIDAIAAWDELEQSMAEEVGFSIEDLLNAVGPEVLLIFDDAGDYGALRIRDRKLWDRVIDGVAESIEVEPEKRRIGRHTYYHWGIESELMDLDEAPETESHWFAEMFARAKDHTYWTYEGDYLFFASVPQILMDRHELGADTDIATWLRERQRIDASTAFMSISGTSRKLPERVYAVYLELLQLLADVAQTEIDIWSMPTARQLDLPRAGTLGFTLSLGNPTLAAEFTFENNPAEFLGGAGGIVVAGVVAAIAIPAYQDYTIRARVSEGLILSESTKFAVSEHYVDTGEFPGQGMAAELSEYTGDSPHVQSIIVEPGTGRIVINYSVESFPDGGQIYLRPYADEVGDLQWDCSGTFPDKHLPAQCRGGEANGRTGA
jgi:hypothetical protein